jgi:hypothetical protein
MKRVFLAIMIIMLGVSMACSSALSIDQRTSDSDHAFLIHSAQIIDRINADVPPEDQVYLVIKYEVENLQSQDDSLRRWIDQIILEVGKKPYEPILVESLDNQLWETSLLQNQIESGYVIFTVPEDAYDFRLTFTFPGSENKVAYEFKAVDKRIEINVEYVLTKLGQVERTQRIPLVGGILAAFTSSPIRYLGTILVPEDEVSDLLAQTKDLSDDAKKKVIENYLLAHGHCRLE